MCIFSQNGSVSIEVPDSMFNQRKIKHAMVIMAPFQFEGWGLFCLQSSYNYICSFQRKLNRKDAKGNIFNINGFRLMF